MDSGEIPWIPWIPWPTCSRSPLCASFPATFSKRALSTPTATRPGASVDPLDSGNSSYGLMDIILCPYRIQRIYVYPVSSCFSYVYLSRLLSCLFLFIFRWFLVPRSDQRSSQQIRNSETDENRDVPDRGQQRLFACFQAFDADLEEPDEHSDTDLFQFGTTN